MYTVETTRCIVCGLLVFWQIFTQITDFLANFQQAANRLFGSASSPFSRTGNGHTKHIMATSRTQKLLKTRGERAQVGPPKVSVDVGSRFGHGEPNFGQTLRPPFGHGPPGFAKQSDRHSDTGPG